MAHKESQNKNSAKFFNFKEPKKFTGTRKFKNYGEMVSALGLIPAKRGKEKEKQLEFLRQYYIIEIHKDRTTTIRYKTSRLKQKETKDKEQEKITGRHRVEEALINNTYDPLIGKYLKVNDLVHWELSDDDLVHNYKMVNINGKFYNIRGQNLLFNFPDILGYFFIMISTGTKTSKMNYRSNILKHYSFYNPTLEIKQRLDSLIKEDVLKDEQDQKEQFNQLYSDENAYDNLDTSSTNLQKINYKGTHVKNLNYLSTLKDFLTPSLLNFIDSGYKTLEKLGLMIEEKYIVLESEKDNNKYLSGEFLVTEDEEDCNNYEVTSIVNNVLNFYEKSSLEELFFIKNDNPTKKYEFYDITDKNHNSPIYLSPDEYYKRVYDTINNELLQNYYGTLKNLKIIRKPIINGEIYTVDEIELLRKQINNEEIDLRELIAPLDKLQQEILIFAFEKYKHNVCYQSALIDFFNIFKYKKLYSLKILERKLDKINEDNNLSYLSPQKRYFYQHIKEIESDINLYLGYTTSKGLGKSIEDVRLYRNKFELIDTKIKKQVNKQYSTQDFSQLSLEEIQKINSQENIYEDIYTDILFYDEDFSDNYSLDSIVKEYFYELCKENIYKTYHYTLLDKKYRLKHDRSLTPEKRKEILEEIKQLESNFKNSSVEN